mmetsp:Transcript_27928/g.47796  ORF Transcript_27928/g.47796 Transcript_27928/m.47796 type:complete len:206 (+) Transcript_27928:415-1032(+)
MPACKSSVFGVESPDVKRNKNHTSKIPLTHCIATNGPAATNGVSLVCPFMHPPQQHGTVCAHQFVVKRIRCAVEMPFKLCVVLPCLEDLDRHKRRNHAAHKESCLILRLARCISVTVPHVKRPKGNAKGGATLVRTLGVVPPGLDLPPTVLSCVDVVHHVHTQSVEVAGHNIVEVFDPHASRGRIPPALAVAPKSTVHFGRRHGL